VTGRVEFLFPYFSLVTGKLLKMSDTIDSGRTVSSPVFTDEDNVIRIWLTKNHYQRHGHTDKVCCSKHRYSRCANSHQTSSCTINRENNALFKCPNCLGNHHAKDKAYPITKNVGKVIVKAVQEKTAIGAPKKVCRYP